MILTPADFVALRHRLQLTQPEMARLLLVGYRTLQKYEYGEVQRPIRATVARVEALARALDLPGPTLATLTRSPGFQRRAGRLRSRTLGQVDGRDAEALRLHDACGLSYGKVGARLGVGQRQAWKMARRARLAAALDKNAAMG